MRRIQITFKHIPPTNRSPSIHRDYLIRAGGKTVGSLWWCTPNHFIVWLTREDKYGSEEIHTKWCPWNTLDEEEYVFKMVKKVIRKPATELLNTWEGSNVQR